MDESCNSSSNQQSFFSKFKAAISGLLPSRISNQDTTRTDINPRKRVYGTDEATGSNTQTSLLKNSLVQAKFDFQQNIVKEIQKEQSLKVSLNKEVARKRIRLSSVSSKDESFLHESVSSSSNSTKPLLNYRTLCEDNYFSNHLSSSNGFSALANSKVNFSASRESLNCESNTDLEMSSTASRISNNLVKRNIFQSNNTGAQINLSALNNNSSFVARKRRYVTNITNNKSYLARIESRDCASDNIFSVRPKNSGPLLLNVDPNPSNRIDFSQIRRLSVSDSQNGNVANEWKCCSCSESNSIKFKFCPSCAEPNPLLSTSRDRGFTTLEKGKSLIWICARCSTKNDQSKTYCVCCFGKEGLNNSTTKESESRSNVNNFVTESWSCLCCNTKNCCDNNLCSQCTAPKSIPKNYHKSTDNSENTEKSTIDSALWYCSNCYTSNNVDGDTCVSCCNVNPNFKQTRTSNNNKYMNSDDSIRFNTKKSTEMWNCDTCMVHNNYGVDKCVCCATPNPSLSDKLDISSTSSSVIKFGSSSFVNSSVTNFELTPSSVFKFDKSVSVVNSGIVSTSNSQISLFKFGSDGTSDLLKSWYCSDCFAPNDHDSKKCVCCGNTNPDAKHNSGEDKVLLKPSLVFGNLSEKPSATSFKFGSTSKNIEPEKVLNNKDAKNVSEQWYCSDCFAPNTSESNNCVCCDGENLNAKQNNNQDKVKSTISSVFLSSQPTLPFKFGSTAANVERESVQSFKFGSNSNVDVNKSSIESETSFKFGSTNPSVKFGSGSSVSSIFVKNLQNIKEARSSSDVIANECTICNYVTKSCICNVDESPEGSGSTMSHSSSPIVVPTLTSRSCVEDKSVKYRTPNSTKILPCTCSIDIDDDNTCSKCAPIFHDHNQHIAKNSEQFRYDSISFDFSNSISLGFPVTQHYPPDIEFNFNVTGNNSH